MVNLTVRAFNKRKFTKAIDAAFDAIRDAYPGKPSCSLTGDVYLEYTHLIRYYLLKFAQDCTFNGVNTFDVERTEIVHVRTTQEEEDELKAIESELDRLYAPDVPRLKCLWVRLVTMDMFASNDERVLAALYEVEQRIIYGSMVYKNTTVWTAASDPNGEDERLVRVEAIKRSEKADDGIGICIMRRISRDTGDNTFIAYAYNKHGNKSVYKTETAPKETRWAVQHAIIVMLRNEVAR